MPSHKLYHDYVNGKLIPYWYVMTFSSGEIHWNNNVFYFDVVAPFEYFDRDEFDDCIISTSIFMDDFIKSEVYPNKLGISIEKVKQRIIEFGLDPELVTQFIIPVPDVDEVLMLIPNGRFGYGEYSTARN